MTVKRFKYQTDLTVADDAETPIIGVVRANSLTAGLAIASVANEAPTGDLNTQVPIRVSSTRRFGLIARHIVLQRLTTATTSPNIQRVRIVVLQPDIFAGFISQVGGSIAFNGLEDWIIIGAQAERYHLFFGVSS